LLFTRQNTLAAEWAHRAVSTRPNVPEHQLVLASCLGHAGEIDEARRALSECERLQPGYSTTPENWQRIKLRTDMEYFLDGLRKAGWEG
jgi:Flp pilus assembly protein TadD